MRVLVCGGRDFKDYKFLTYMLDGLERVAVIIEGGARGADLLARRWALARGIQVETFEADWEGRGRAAGPIRNRKMIREGKPHLIVAFDGATGTDNCVRQGMSASIPIHRYWGRDQSAVWKEGDSVDAMQRVRGI